MKLQKVLVTNCASPQEYSPKELKRIKGICGLLSTLSNWKSILLLWERRSSPMTRVKLLK